MSDAGKTRPTHQQACSTSSPRSRRAIAHSLGAVQSGQRPESDSATFTGPIALRRPARRNRSSLPLHKTFLREAVKEREQLPIEDLGLLDVHDMSRLRDDDVAGPR